MGLVYLDLVFRCEQRFWIKIDREEMTKLAARRGIQGPTVGDLYEVVHGKAVEAGVFDAELDGEIIWSLFRREVSTALVVDPEVVVKSKSLIRDLGMS